MIAACEQWRPVAGFPGYEVSDLGRVRCWNPCNAVARAPVTPRLLKAGPNTHGYPHVSLFHRGAQRIRRVHVLVLEAFVGPRPPGCDACHCNGIKTDNRVTNLRWDSAKENNRDRALHGTLPRGENVAGAKLTAERVHLMRFLASVQAANADELAAWFGVNRRTAQQAISGETWAHLPMVAAS